MNLYFNELSLIQSSDRQVAREYFQYLAQTFKKSSEQGFKEIKVPAIFFSHQFAGQYMFFQWVNDPEVDADLRTLVKSVITTTPIIEEMLSEKDEASGTVFECRFQGKTAIGLGAASSYMFDTISVSLPTDGMWETGNVQVSIAFFDGEELQEIEDNVRHIAQPEHLDVHSGWLQQQRDSLVPTGQLLWLRREEIFPNLVFCAHVERQITFFSGIQPEFIQIKKRLFELETCAALRSAGIFHADMLPTKVTPESETRLRQFANELIQRCPDGETRTFSWHSRYTPGAGRIHFYPLEGSNKIIIGSIGGANEIK